MDLLLVMECINCPVLSDGTDRDLNGAFGSFSAGVFEMRDDSFKYGMPLFCAEWLSADVFFLGGGGGAAATGIQQSLDVSWIVILPKSPL